MSIWFRRPEFASAFCSTCIHYDKTSHSDFHINVWVLDSKKKTLLVNTVYISIIPFITALSVYSPWETSLTTKSWEVLSPSTYHVTLSRSVVDEVLIKYNMVSWSELLFPSTTEFDLPAFKTSLNIVLRYMWLDPFCLMHVKWQKICTEWNNQTGSRTASQFLSAASKNSLLNSSWMWTSYEA